MSIVKITNKNKGLFNITAILTVITLVFYLFVFALPHNLHCSKELEASVLTKLLKVVEKSHHEDVSNDPKKEDNSQQEHSQDNCPICNLSYFNSLNFSKPLIINLALQVTNEKPINTTATGFSSSTYFKFFLRSPPTFIC
ncbi:MAG: hypothetical protein IKP71_06255 [Candidatus Riflebacteria bacterium]|nr:hypothetical protein [Candidatus Riflebacteria bacterium]